MIAGEEALFTDIDVAWFFPTERRIMRYAPYREVMLDGGRVQISTEQHRRYDDARDELEGLLSVRDDNGELRALNSPQRAVPRPGTTVLKSNCCPRPPTLCRVKLPGWRSGSTRLSTGTPTGKWG